MTVNVISCITQVASFLKVPAGKIQLNANSLPVRISNNITTTGFIPIIFELMRQAKSTAVTTNLEDKAELRQWLEYVIVYALHCDTPLNVNHILKELDNVLSTKTYLVSSNLCIADVVLFYGLYHIMANLTYLEKEKYLNLSRWFDNVQQDANVRQKNKIVDFSTNYLVAVAPARH